MSDRADGRPAHAAQMRDHWWWRPGWRVGRRFYTWFLTFEGQHDVRRLAQVYQDRLDVQSLDLVPLEWLHLTMQGVGFVDEVNAEEVERVASAAAVRCACLGSLTLTLGPARATSEGVVLDVAPTEPVCALRETLRAAIADVWSVDRVPETGREFVPHVSLAYSNTAAPAAPVVEAVKSVSARPAGLTVTAAHMIVLSRDARVYHWEVFATVGLGG
ncbi:MAG: 2'-5' RNA ligase family protein [Egibacteraceae bacterium]